MKENVKGGLKQMGIGGIVFAGSIHELYAMIKALEDLDCDSTLATIAYMVWYWCGVIACSIGLLVGLVLIILGFSRLTNPNYYDEIEDEIKEYPEE